MLDEIELDRWHRNCSFFLEPTLFSRRMLDRFFSPLFFRSIVPRKKLVERRDGRATRYHFRFRFISLEREVIPVGGQTNHFLRSGDYSVASRPFVDIISSGNRNKRERDRLSRGGEGAFVPRWSRVRTIQERRIKTSRVDRCISRWFLAQFGDRVSMKI